MELTNKRVMYSVKNEDSNLKLTGEVQLSESSITEFSGNFFTLAEEYSGNFSYSESGTNINCSINSYPSSLQDKGMILLDTTIKAIKQELEQ